MAALPLLQDSSCSIQQSCLTDPSSAHARCPQTMKCGTCVAWSPREKNRFTRNSGQCLLDRSSTQFLDCNAPICPYYRPRADSPAAVEWQARGAVARRTAVHSRTKKMSREAPPPTKEALAHAAFRDHADAVGSFGAATLAGMLGAVEPLPALLERFRGGTARVGSPTSPAREVPVEALWARLVLLRRSLGSLDEALAGSALDAATKEKVQKDLAGIAGSMTTFNLLFARKEDGFKGSGKGE
jgi:hypothetical protein